MINMGDICTAFVVLYIEMSTNTSNIIEPFQVLQPGSLNVIEQLKICQIESQFSWWVLTVPNRLLFNSFHNSFNLYNGN